MATERFSFIGDASTNHYLAIFNASGQVFDWNDSTFKALASATTKATVGTEQADLGGTSKSAYIKDVDLSTLNSTSTAAKFRADWYTDANATALVSNTTEFTVKSSALAAAESISIADGFSSAGADPAATPGPTATYGAKLDYLFNELISKMEVTASTRTIYNDAGTAISEQAISDDGTTFTREALADP